MPLGTDTFGAALFQYIDVVKLELLIHYLLFAVLPAASPGPSHPCLPAWTRHAKPGWWWGCCQHLDQPHGQQQRHRGHQQPCQQQYPGNRHRREASALVWLHPMPGARGAPFFPLQRICRQCGNHEDRRSVVATPAITNQAGQFFRIYGFWPGLFCSFMLYILSLPLGQSGINVISILAQNMNLGTFSD